MKRWWERWIAYTSQVQDARLLAVVRIAVALCLVIDLLRHAWLGLVPWMMVDWEHGGISKVVDSTYVLDSLLGAERAGVFAWWVSTVCFIMVALGIRVRAAIVVGVLFYAQVGHAFPPGDRGIDRLLRTVLLILLFSESHRRFALGGGPRKEWIAAWPSLMLTWLLFLVYLSAGFAKLLSSPHWLAISGRPMLYRVMADPLAGYVDPAAAVSLYPLFFIGSWATILVEMGAFMVLTRWAKWWAVAAAWIHIGIAATMKLGMFSFGMLSLYPVLAEDWVLGLLDRFEPLRNRTGEPAESSG